MLGSPYGILLHWRLTQATVFYIMVNQRDICPPYYSRYKVGKYGVGNLKDDYLLVETAMIPILSEVGPKIIPPAPSWERGELNDAALFV